MNIDFTAASIATMSVFIGGHLIAFLVQQGENKQWKKDYEEKIKSMQQVIEKFQKTDTQQQLGAQRIEQFFEALENHMEQDKEQFKLLGDKIDASAREVLRAVVELGKPK